MFILEGMRAAWARSTGADQLTVRQLKRMFDAADGSGSNGRDGEHQPSQGLTGLCVHAYTPASLLTPTDHCTVACT
jgi:hypothetical protein